MGALAMKKILFFFLFLIGIKAHAQYSSFDFIHVCGNPEKGKFLPMEQDSFRKAFSGNNLIEGFEHHSILFAMEVLLSIWCPG
jgi:hypothetical protein